MKEENSPTNIKLLQCSIAILSVIIIIFRLKNPIVGLGLRRHANTHHLDVGEKPLCAFHIISLYFLFSGVTEHYQWLKLIFYSYIAELFENLIFIFMFPIYAKAFLVYSTLQIILCALLREFLQNKAVKLSYGIYEDND